MFPFSLDDTVLQEIENTTTSTMNEIKKLNSVNSSFVQFIKAKMELGKALLINFGFVGRLKLINLTSDESSGKIAADEAGEFFPGES